LIEELSYKISCLENEMDIRVESLIQQIHNHSNEFRHQLKKLKEDFEK
jgi:hypothetical protein